MFVNVSLRALVEQLHAEVKLRSSVPKVAAAIGMNYYSLRDNLLGNSDIRLSTMLAVLDALGMTLEDLVAGARVREREEARKASRSRRSAAM